jgi:hypothetical protein
VFAALWDWSAAAGVTSLLAAAMVSPASSLSSCADAFVSEVGAAGCGAFGDAALSAGVAAETAAEACALAVFSGFAFVIAGAAA